MYENGDNNYELSEYQIIPQVTILAGQTSGSLTLNGIEDELNSPGEETDETIVLNFQTPTRAVLTSDELIDNITLTLLNNRDRSCRRCRCISKCTSFKFLFSSLGRL